MPPPFPRRGLPLALALALAVSLPGCTSDSGPSPGARPPPTPKFFIAANDTADGFAFSPASITVPLNSLVTWEGKGTGIHKLAFKVDPSGAPPPPGDGPAFETREIRPGDTYSILTTAKGEFAYYCAFHSDGATGMTGMLTVT